MEPMGGIRDVISLLLDGSAAQHGVALNNFAAGLGRCPASRKCGNYLCVNLDCCAESALPTKLCHGCRQVRYCSVGCQKHGYMVGTGRFARWSERLGFQKSPDGLCGMQPTFCGRCTKSVLLARGGGTVLCFQKWCIDQSRGCIHVFRQHKYPLCSPMLTVHSWGGAVYHTSLVCLACCWYLLWAMCLVV